MDLSSLMNPGGAGGPSGDDGLTDNSETITISSLALLKMLKRELKESNILCRPSEALNPRRFTSWRAA